MPTITQKVSCQGIMKLETCLFLSPLKSPIDYIRIKLKVYRAAWTSRGSVKTENKRNLQASGFLKGKRHSCTK